ncbi:anti-sigma factor [Tautonia sociabilis]|uniref:Zinc-finger domain-containing protein n=1 Tax=Tautonia sociabilis TaxID=2080755 RepID=A0A432MS89_9BACT|nr:hypothetical protein [Tautonia sociabilis]RUL89788.1 hypothetical protein TsocGM_01095 [Tautonia sociabilis]
MAAEQLRLTAEERADLVAYLDGELPADRASALAEKLTRSVSGRREIEALETSWNLLDLLPRPRAGSDFTDRTLTLVAEAPAADDRLVGAARRTMARLLALLAVAASIGLGGAVGYSVARWLIPDRTSRLARDLTIAERLDAYRAVGDLEFLRRLDETTLFKEASD